MSRFHALAALAVLLAGAAHADDPAAKDAAAPVTPAAAPATAAPTPDGAAPLDPKIDALVRRAVEKAKRELREEFKLERQNDLAAAEFLGTTTEGPKLQFFELHGYFRTRGDLFNNFNLGRTALDTANQPVTIFPTPVGGGSTFTSSNMRLRLEPTVNVSSHVRVQAQIDVLDNYVLGSSASKVQQGAGSPYPVPLYGSSRVLYPNDPTADRAPILPKRVWGEVETPIGLASFGRMPAAWGLGIMENAGSGLDDDYGDTVDRLQFASVPLPTPLGGITVIPFVQFDDAGVLFADPHFGTGVGQPFAASQGDSGETWGLKIVHVDSDDDLRRKLERGESSQNFGLYYQYKTQRTYYPTWSQYGFADTAGGTAAGTNDPNYRPVGINRGTFAHVLDLWYRYQSARLTIETEWTGVIGQINDPRSVLTDPNTAPSGYTGQQVLLRQFGGVIRGTYALMPDKLKLLTEVGIASGDAAPGMGVSTSTNYPTLPGQQPVYGVLDGPQFNVATRDHSIRNFRFDPDYNIDMILWREIIGQVTDAWYVRPSVHWDAFGGLALDGAIIYSQALYATSTPSSTGPGTGNKPLGIEADLKVSYTSDDGLNAWVMYGFFNPLSAFDPGPLTRANAIRAGVALKF